MFLNTYNTCKIFPCKPTLYRDFPLPRLTTGGYGSMWIGSNHSCRSLWCHQHGCHITFTQTQIILSIKLVIYNSEFQPSNSQYVSIYIYIHYICPMKSVWLIGNHHVLVPSSQFGIELPFQPPIAQSLVSMDDLGVPPLRKTSQGSIWIEKACSNQQNIHKLVFILLKKRLVFVRTSICLRFRMAMIFVARQTTAGQSP